MSLEGSSVAGSRPGARARAVVWRGAAGGVPADLGAALHRQAIAWEESAGPYDALSRLLAMPRESAGGLGKVLLLVEPETLVQADEVRRVLERVDPQTGVWAYRAASQPRLAPLAPLPKAPEPEIVVKARPKPSNGSHLRLAGGPAAAGGASAAAAGTEAGEPESPRSVLTPEELEMLLADDRE